MQVVERSRPQRVIIYLVQVSSRVPPPHKQTPLVDYLAQRFTYIPADLWHARVRAGSVFRNNQPATLETTVGQGDTITCEIPDYTPPEFNTAYTIVYEDEWLLGINKPANLRVHGHGKWTTANLIYHLRTQHEPPYPDTHLINRLDADTTGVVLVARDLETLKRMGTLFLTQQVEKTYLGVVMGIPTPAQGVIDKPIGPVQGAKAKTRHGVENIDKPRTAVTEYKLLRPLSAHHALLQLHPLTGRTHQLRVHLAAIGHPLVGDALYQMDDEHYLAWCEGQYEPDPPLHLERQALHCAETRFTHPWTGHLCTISAPLPEDWHSLIQSLSNHPQTGSIQT